MLLFYYHGFRENRRRRGDNYLNRRRRRVEILDHHECRNMQHGQHDNSRECGVKHCSVTIFYSDETYRNEHARE
jgi:hypothetical protein